MQTSELADFPFTGERRPFDWHLVEPPAQSIPSHYLCSSLETESFADLKLCIYLYMMHRREMYVNYMAGAKNLFAIFFPSDHCLKEMAPAWESNHTSLITSYRKPEDWTPAYEIQRLYLITKIHWSWLEVAWLECEIELFESGQPWMIKKLERTPLL